MHTQATLTIYITEKTVMSPDPGLSNQVVSDLHPMVAEAPLLVEGYVKFQNRHLQLLILWSLQEYLVKQAPKLKIKKGPQAPDDATVPLTKS